MIVDMGLMVNAQADLLYLESLKIEIDALAKKLKDSLDIIDNPAYTWSLFPEHQAIIESYKGTISHKEKILSFLKAVDSSIEMQKILLQNNFDYILNKKDMQISQLIDKNLKETNEINKHFVRRLKKMEEFLDEKEYEELRAYIRECIDIYKAQDEWERININGRELI